ncbi:MAG: hypothetical protein OQL27_11485 [Sedimenticola sp.]|nr:hypothetical protein [Sedimenticola sp.]
MAQGIDRDSTNWQGTRTVEYGSSGLLFSLPTIDQDQLQQEVSRLNQQLEERQSSLNNIIDRNRFTATDAVLIAALPGGLIYAAIKKQRIVTAEKELNSIQTQISNLNEHPADQPALPQYGLFAAR